MRLSAGPRRGEDTTLNDVHPEHSATRRPGRKTDRTAAPRAPALAEAVVISEWRKNRGGESVKVQIKPFENAVLIDIRTWYGEDGYRKPGKGFAATIKHLPALAKAMTAACASARDLGLLDNEQS